jgi:dTDP-4-amino-4,6-dideoxygalactose transaminase
MSRLEEEGIATRQGTHAPVLTGYYRNKYGFVDTQFPNALLAERLTLTLPLYVQLTDEEQGVVADRLRHVLH